MAECNCWEVTVLSSVYNMCASIHIWMSVFTICIVFLCNREQIIGSSDLGTQACAIRPRHIVNWGKFWCPHSVRGHRCVWVAKVDVPNSATYLILIRHLCLSSLWFGVAPRMKTKKTSLEENWTECSMYDNYFRAKVDEANSLSFHKWTPILGSLLAVQSC